MGVFAEYVHRYAKPGDTSGRGGAGGEDDGEASEMSECSSGNGFSSEEDEPDMEEEAPAE